MEIYIDMRLPNCDYLVIAAFLCISLVFDSARCTALKIEKFGLSFDTILKEQNDKFVPLMPRRKSSKFNRMGKYIS